jgi:hypothetical protein
MATAPNTNINIPFSSFIDQTTGRPTQAWLTWLMNPNVISISTQFTIINGGEINNTIIGNVSPSTGTFTNLTALNGIGGGIF